MQIMWALRSVPYSRFPEHSALCATVCKTKLDKCSPHTVDHWCQGLGLKFCWEIGMCRIQPCFCWSKKPKLWIMFNRIQEFSGIAVSCHPDRRPTVLQWEMVIFVKLTHNHWRGMENDLQVNLKQESNFLLDEHSPCAWVKSDLRGLKCVDVKLYSGIKFRIS